MGLLVFVAVVFFIIYLLGEQAGREGPARSKQLQDIVTKKAELKNLQSNLSPTPIVHLLLLGVLAFAMLKVLGLWQDDDDYRYRRRR